MKLKNIFSKLKTSQKEEEEIFLAVEIAPETVKSVLWTVRKEKTEVIKIGSLQEWDGENKDLLLKAVDVSISNACEKAKTEPRGVIFGLPKSWVKKEQIVPKKKEFLKYICQKLELKPLGFVVILESILAYLKTKEGTPVNGIFINLQETQSLISLVQLGKIKGTQTVGRSEDLAADVKEGLVRFGKIENLPARMIIFNGTVDFEEYKQQLASYDWLEELPFLHFPKVEVLEVNESIKAIAIAGGAEVAKSLGFEIKDRKEVKPIKSVKPKEDKEESREDRKENNAVSAADLGFVQDKDIAQIETHPATPDAAEVEKVEKVEREELRPEIKIKGIPQPFSLISKLKNMLRKLIFKLRLLLPGGRKRLVVLIALCFFLFTGGAMAFYWYVPKAKVTIYLTPKTLEKELKLIVDGEQKNIEVKGENATSATGEKLVGDKAKGKVIIYNKTDIKKVFSLGAVLIGPENLKFTLDEEVEIASKSSEAGEEGEQIIYGKATAAITAASIGTESNFTGGTLFSFKDYSTNLYSAKTEEGLSGGTSRQVKVVSSDDTSLLLEELHEELKEKAETDLRENLSSEKEILTEGMEDKILSQDFSAEEGDETDQLKLELKIAFSALVYDKRDLRITLAESIKDAVPDDFVFDPEKTEIETEEVEVKENKAEMITKVKAHLLPKINFEEIKKNLVGRQFDDTQEYLRSLPNFSQADIEVTPRLLGRLKRLPRLGKNIIIETKVEE